MLIDRQKINLNKLLEQYESFQYLRPPLSVYKIKISQEDQFVDLGNNHLKRKIYYGVNYKPQELKAINEVRALMPNAGIFQNLTDELILKHLYTVSMDYHKTIQRLLLVQQFHNNPLITNFTSKTLACLQKGGLYTFGHDKMMRPIIILRADKFDCNLSVDENYNAVYFMMMVVIGYRLVPHFAQKYICIMDFNNMKISDIPFQYLYEIISKMGVYYCGNVERSFIYNFKTMNFLWSMISRFIPEHSKKKIVFVQQNSYSSISEYIEPQQLEKRYGGTQDNQTSFWPPKNVDLSNQKTLYEDIDNTSYYYSVDNDLDYFGQSKSQNISCWKTCGDCSIY